jgi:hypothetical protein
MSEFIFMCHSVRIYAVACDSCIDNSIDPCGMTIKCYLFLITYIVYTQDFHLKLCLLSLRLLVLLNGHQECSDDGNNHSCNNNWMRNDHINEK